MYVTIFVNKLFKLLGAYRDFHPSQAVLLLLLLLFTHQCCYCCYRLLTRLSCYCYCLLTRLSCYCYCFPWQLHMSGQSCNLAMSQLKDGSSSLSFKSLWEKTENFQQVSTPYFFFHNFNQISVKEKLKDFEKVSTLVCFPPLCKESQNPCLKVQPRKISESLLAN